MLILLHYAKTALSSMWNMVCQRFISILEPKWIVAIAIIASQIIWHTLIIQNNNGWSFCHLCSKSRGGIFLKTTAFLLTHGLKLSSGMTDGRFSVLFSNWSEKKNHKERKNQMHLRHIIKCSKLFITAVWKYSSQFSSRCMSSS